MSEKVAKYKPWEALIFLLPACIIPPTLIYLLSIPWQDQIFPDFNSTQTSLASQLAAIEPSPVESPVQISEPTSPNHLPTPSRIFNLEEEILYCRPLESSATRPLTTKPIRVIYVPNPLVCH